MSVDFARMDRAFNPKVVAVIGDKKPGYMWLNGQIGFKGKLYSVQVDPSEFEGIKALGVQNVMSIGDCREPGTIMDAVWGGFNAVREIEQ